MKLSEQLMAVKSMEALQQELVSENRLRRVLGPISLTALGVGAIIGAGIFVLTGLAAHDFAGPSLMLSFVLAGLGCAFAGLCYAEFASTIPVAGSAYTYAYATLGELAAWIIGWDLILEYGMASSTVAYGWSKYLLQFLGLFDIHLPVFLASDPFSVPGAWCNLPAALICLLVTVILVIGIRESAGFNAAMVALKLVVVLFVIAVGSAYVDPGNWQPFMPIGFGGVARGAGYVFFAYIGFDSVSTHAEEARNPQRDVPIGIMASLLLCTVLYVAVAAVLTGMVPYQQIDINAPLAAAFARYGLTAAVFIISLGAVAGITSVLLVLMLSQPRVFFAMARDGLLPYSFFGTVHPALPDAAQGDDPDRHAGGAGGGAVSDPCAGRNGEHRHPVRVCRRLRRSADLALHEPRPAASVPLPAGAVGADPRHSVQRRPDVLARVAQLGAPRHLAGGRPGDLLRVQPLPQQAGARRRR